MDLLASPQPVSITHAAGLTKIAGAPLPPCLYLCTLRAAPGGQECHPPPGDRGDPEGAIGTPKGPAWASGGGGSVPVRQRQPVPRRRTTVPPPGTASSWGGRRAGQWPVVTSPPPGEGRQDAGERQKELGTQQAPRGTAHSSSLWPLSPRKPPPRWPLESQFTEREADTGRREAVLAWQTRGCADCPGPAPQVSSYVLPSLTHRPFLWSRGQNFGSGPCSGPPAAHATQAPWPGSPGLCSCIWPGLSSHQPWSPAPRSPRSPGPRERRPAGAPGPVKTLQFPRAVSSAPSVHPTQSNSSSAFKTPGAPLIRPALSAVQPCL